MKEALKYKYVIYSFVAVILISIIYAKYASQQIYQESAQHLTEVYTQVNDNFSSMLSENWGLLQSWEEYVALTAAADHQALKDYIEKERRLWGFTEFYFLSTNGGYITADGNMGYLNLGRELAPLVMEKKAIVADTSLPDSGALLIFAIPVEEGCYENFTYTAIAIGFNIEDLADALDVTKFFGQGVCFVTYVDGRVLFSSDAKTDHPRNVLTTLEGAQWLDQDADAVAQDWKEQQSNVVRFRMDGVTYYLTYQPVGLSNWMLAGVLPTQFVNAATQSYTLVTLIVVALLMILITGSVVYLITGYRRVEKYNQLMQKNEIQLKHMANYDQLTGVKNRNALTQTIHILEQSSCALALAIVDVDFFKQVNDTYGHITGDQVLKKVAESLETACQSEYIFRMGGDEFIVILMDVTQAQERAVQDIFLKVNETLQAPTDGLPPVSLSVGVAFSSQGYQEELYSQADKALYAVKKQGRCGCQVFDYIMY